MGLYIKSRFSTRLLSIYVIFMCALVLCGSLHIYLPSFVAAVSQATPVTVIISCGVSTVGVFSLRGGYPLFEKRAVRNIPVLDLCILFFSVAVFFILALCTHGWAPAIVLLRALLGFEASALLVSTYAGHYLGVSTPGILFIIFTLFGAKSDGSGKAWAFAVSDIDAGFSWVLVVTLCICGSYVWVHHYPRTLE